MGDEESGNAYGARQFFQLDAHLFTELGVQVTQRLVQQQKPRLAHERPRQRHALLLAAAQLCRRPACQAFHLNHCQSVGDILFNFRLGKLFLTAVAVQQGKSHVVKHIHVRPNRVGLKNHADRPLFGRNCDLPLC